MSWSGPVALVVVLVLATAAGLAWRRRTGRLVAPPRPRRTALEDSAHRIRPDEIGSPLGERATLVQFSSAFCHPCIATRHVLAAVADVVPGVRHVEVDAESHLDLVRRLRIGSTPTTLILDGGGAERRRATGVPRKHAVLAALDGIAGHQPAAPTHPR